MERRTFFGSLIASILGLFGIVPAATGQRIFYKHSFNYSPDWLGKDFLARRYVAGVFRFSTEHHKQDLKSAFSCIPTMPLGWCHESSEYHVSPDGKRLDYKITWKEIYRKM